MLKKLYFKKPEYDGYINSLSSLVDCVKDAFVAGGTLEENDSYKILVDGMNNFLLWNSHSDDYTALMELFSLYLCKKNPMHLKKETKNNIISSLVKNFNFKPYDDNIVESFELLNNYFSKKDKSLELEVVTLKTNLMKENNSKKTQIVINGFLVKSNSEVIENKNYELNEILELSKNGKFIPFNIVFSEQISENLIEFNSTLNTKMIELFLNKFNISEVEINSNKYPDILYSYLDALDINSLSEIIVNFFNEVLINIDKDRNKLNMWKHLVNLKKTTLENEDPEKNATEVLILTEVNKHLEICLSALETIDASLKASLKKENSNKKTEKQVENKKSEPKNKKIEKDENDADLNDDSLFGEHNRA